MQKPKRKAGRPRIQINWTEVNSYLEADCTGREVAAKIGVHEDTLYHAVEREFKMLFSDYSAQKKAKGDALLKAAQFKSAMSGNISAQIWLGKQRLGQKDKIETKNENHTYTGFDIKGCEEENG